MTHADGGGPARYEIAARLESERVVLDPLVVEHAAELAPVLADVALYRFIGGGPESSAQLRERFRRQAVGLSPDRRERWLNWVVRLRPGGAAIGWAQATVTTVSGDESAEVAVVVAELAWVIGTAYQGQGLAKEAASLMAAWLRGQGVDRLRAHIHPEHQASMAVARSLGLLPGPVVVDGERRWESPSGTL
jgi:RimJ/RimL family protein N-acetyltransferase